jgi:hypothetical protein
VDTRLREQVGDLYEFAALFGRWRIDRNEGFLRAFVTGTSSLCAALRFGLKIRRRAGL